MQAELLKELIRTKKVIWTNHVRKRMEQRRIKKGDIIECILKGEIIEDYPDSYPFPSCLILGIISSKQIIHVVVGYDGENMRIITVYIPDETKFESNYRVRRKK